MVVWRIRFVCDSSRVTPLISLAAIRLSLKYYATLSLVATTPGLFYVSVLHTKVKPQLSPSGCEVAF